MHPCCWGPFLQSIAQALPFLAVIFFAGKKLFSMFRHLLPFKQKAKTVDEKVEPISVEVPSCCTGKAEKIELVKFD